jgi:tetratricopeptide (TPR) repeat protein
MLAAAETLSLFPSYMPAKAYRARGLAGLQLYKAAFEEFDALREVFHENPKREAEWARSCFIGAMYYAAKAALSQANADQCIVYLNEALSVDWVADLKVSREWFFYLYAKALLKQERYESAIEYLTYVWHLGCRKDYVYRYLAVAFLSIDDTTRAAQCIDRQTPADRGSVQNLVVAARIARLRGDFTTAVRYVDDAVRNCKPGSKHKILYERGLLARDMQDVEVARRSFLAANDAKLRNFNSDYQEALRELYLLNHATAR